MSNLNAAPAYSKEDDDDSKDKTPLFAPVAPPRPTSESNLSFLFNTEAQAAEQAKKQSFAENFFNLNKEAQTNTAEDEDDEEDDSGESKDGTPNTKKRRKTAGQRLRKLFKRNRPKEAAPVSATNVESLGKPTPTTPEAPAPLSEAAPVVSETVDPTPVPSIPVAVEATEPWSSHTPETPTATTAPEASREKSQEEPNPPEYPQSTLETEPPKPPTPPRPPRTTPGSGGPNGPNNPNIINRAGEASSTPIPSLANRQPDTIIEQGNAAGPAILAFLGAEFLSRRRDRKIRRTAKKLDKQVKENQNQAETERQRATNVEVQSRNISNNQQQRIAALERPPQPVSNKSPNIIPDIPPIIRVTEQSPDITIPKQYEQTIKLPEQQKSTQEAITPTELITAPLAFNTTLEKQSVNQPESRVIEPLPGKPEKHHEKPRSNEYYPASEQRPAYKITPEQRPPASPTPEVQAPVREIDFDRRHEVKDMPGTPIPPLSSPPSQPQTQSQTQQINTSNPPAQLPQVQPKSGQNAALQIAQKQQDIYKQSMRAGFTIGLAVIVLGVAAYLLLQK